MNESSGNRMIVSENVQSNSTRTQSDSLESILNDNISGSELEEVNRLLFGGSIPKINFSQADLESYAELNDFQLCGYQIDAQVEHLRAPRRVKIAVIQNKIHKSTVAPVAEQMRSIHERVSTIIEVAGKANVNILCLQEAWPMPFAFCTRERLPYTEFAESASDGPTTQLLQEFARKYNMVIVSPILERDATNLDIIWNTAVVIDNNGNYMGKSRKNHIPSVGDFNESSYYRDSMLGHPVFDTAFGKIAINICYGRHHPLNWLAYKINGAEIVFNPCATVDSLSEPMWPIESRCAAIANCYYTCAINRVGTETFPNEFSSGDGKPAHKDFGHFFGSSYITAPDGRRTPGLSRVREGILIADVDLNLCRQASDKFGFQMTARLELYSRQLARATDANFSPQVVPRTSNSARKKENEA